MMKLLSRRFLASTAILGAMVLPTTALAQLNDNIVVTAQKRESTLQDTPIALSAVSDEQLEQSQIRDVRDLPLLVPSLVVNQFANSSATTFTVRGLGTSGFNAGLEPSVGVFVDGVYRSRQGASLNDFIAIERIEVLRGPQSTLYGKNTPAGVISVVTKKPQFDYGFDGEVTGGNHGALVAKASVTGPIGDSEKAAFRVSGNVNQRDGFITNLTTGDDVNGRNRWGARAQLLLEPSDNFSVRIIGDYGSIDENCCAAPTVFNQPQNIAALGFLGATIVPANPFNREVRFEGALQTDQETKGVSGEMNYDFGGATLTSITAYRSFDETSDIDADFTDIALVNNRTLGDDYTTFTQELRLTSNGSGNVDWMVGGYFFKQDLNHSNSTPFGSAIRPFADLASGGAITTLENLTLAAQGLGIPTGLSGPITPGAFLRGGDGLLGASFNQKSTSFAAFTSIDWHATENLTVTTGLRYSNEEKDVVANINIVDPLSELDLNNLAYIPLLTGGTVPANAFAGLSAFQFFAPTGFTSDSNSEDNISGNVIVSYDWSDWFNSYASFTTGYKAGGFNLSNGSQAGRATFLPEKSRSTEIGFKAKLFDNRAQANFAMFNQTVEDFQSNIFNGSAFDLVNAGEIGIRGFEFDIAAQATENLFLTFATTYLDAQYNSFDRGPCLIFDTDPSCIANGFKDFAGRNLAFVNEWNGTATATYTVDIGRFEGFVRGEARYMSPVDLGGDLDPIKKQPAATFVNASFGISDPNGAWQLQFWGKNLTDEEILQGSFNSVGQPGSYNGYPVDPTTFGVTLRVSR